jgi:8-oxo-dGTP diphosphatase
MFAGQNAGMTGSIPAAPRSPILGVGAVIWNDKGEIVLIRRGKPPRQNEWSIPGGHLEWGESLREALVREVREETGLAIEVAGLIDAVDLLARDGSGNVTRHYVLVDYAARAIGGELRAGSDAAEARWVAFSGLGDYELWRETRRIIEASKSIVEGNLT